MTAADPSIRGPATLGLIALALLVLGLGLWSVTATLSGAVMARGRVEVDQSRRPVQHPDGGLVAELLVRDGASVAAGDVLVRLDATDLQAELALVDLRLTDLVLRSARLAAERDGLPAPVFPPDLVATAAERPGLAGQIRGQAELFAARRATVDEMREQLAQRIVQVEAEIAGLVAQQQALDDQAGILRQELAAQDRLLGRGLVPQATALALRRDLARLAGQMAESTAAVAASKGRIAEIRLQITGIAARRSEEAAAELRQIEPVMHELQARRAALADRIARLDLRAPVAGTVMGLAISGVGAVLRPAETALVLVPTDRPLVVIAAISPLHVDEVTPGQDADLAFPALAARDAPRLHGRVTQVSPDALADPATGVAQYGVRIEIAAEELKRLGDRTLVPGMPVDVFLATRPQTPLAYLVEPFAAYFGRAFRES
jgi:HlyD family secretion protein